MNTSLHRTTLAMIAMGIAAGALLASPSASAVNKWRSFHQASNGNCSTSEPSDEGWMSRTPTGYLNTRSNNKKPAHNIEVICSPVGNSYGVYKGPNFGTVAQVAFYARNTRNNADVKLNCVLSVGYVDSAYHSEMPTTKTLTKDGATLPIYWNEPGFAAYYPTPLTVICDVPAGVELTDAYVYQEVDVGN